MTAQAMPLLNMCAGALIPAAGSGERLGLGPKALLRLGRLTLIEILVDTLEPIVGSIVVSAPEGYVHEFKRLLGSRSIVVRGGCNRQESIDKILSVSSAEILLIQDVARPFARRSLCEKVLRAAARHGAAGAFLDPMVPVGYSDGGSIGLQWDRQHARIFQAPQAFSRDILARARSLHAGRQFQSTAQMVIEAGFPLAEVPGNVENIKITTPFDWQVAQRVIAPMLGLI